HPGNRPMQGVPRLDRDGWFVGMAHGLFGHDPGELRSSLITAEEIASSGLDYLALGHVHVFRDVSQGDTCAYYPGAPNVPYAPHRGCVALVELEAEAGVQVREVRLHRDGES
ncbi:MAG: hypothetical protein R3190_02580, partial [Thermoanaerobaculia bacterium]|nr:hypothetical protein [Thermoanaerobaculia bacterium]